MKQEAANRPDPEMQKEQVKAQTQLQLGQQQAQLDQQADERKAQIEAVQMQADIEAQTARRKPRWFRRSRNSSSKKELALLEFQLERELKMAELN
jgi:hypothetical protein